MKKTLLLVVTGLLSTSVSQAITEAYSPPIGGMTITVPAGQTRSIAAPLLHATIGAGAVLGKVDTSGSNYIDVPTANWTPGAFSNVANPYYVRLKTGSAAGRVMMVSTTANTSSRVFLTNDGIDLTLLGGPVNGDSYELVLADTLGTLFGSTTLQGGADASLADNVQVWGGASWLIFYYNTTRSRWERNTDTGASPTRDNFAVRPDRGLMITRRAATDLKMYVMGRVPEAAPKYFHSRSGFTFLSLGLPVNTTLGGLGLQTRAGGWTSGTSAASADNIQVWGGAAWLTFYFDSVNARWQRDGDPTDRTTFAIPAGRPVMIRRLSAAAAVDSLIGMPMLYTIN